MAKPGHNQKRKAKLKKRAERSRKHEPLAYAGKKYQTKALAPIFLQTELGIYESHLMYDSKLTDHDVEAALERLVLQMREGPLPPDADKRIVTEGGEEYLIIANILQNWWDLEVTGELPGRSDLIGILRTILHSIEFWRLESMHPQGYLHFVEGFLKQAGVTVRRVIPEPGSLPEFEG